MLLSILKEEIPFIYDYGNNIIQDIRAKQNSQIIYRKIDELELVLKEFVYVNNKYSDRISKSARFYRELDIKEVIYNLRNSLIEIEFMNNNELFNNNIV